MAKRDLAGRKVKDIEEMSRYWSPEDLIRNLDEEMSRQEDGLGHMIYDLEETRISAWLRPLPVTPDFEMEETEDEFRLSVTLPNISKDNVRLKVEKNSIELYACSDDMVCRPHHLAVESVSTLDPDSAKAKMVGDVLKVTVLKVRKKRLKID